MADSELLREGCKSYHEALFAVMQFRQQVQDTIRSVVEKRKNELAAALKLDVGRMELAGYANPENYRQKFDGSSAAVGLKIPGNPWEARWGLYFYVEVEREQSHFAAHVWLKSRDAVAELVSESPELEHGETWAQIRECLPTSGPVDLAGTANRVLDGWIDLWKKAGGLDQFLPKARAHAAG
jgi:hypothetical protein